MERRIIVVVIVLLAEGLIAKKLWKQEDMIIGYDFEDDADLGNITHGIKDTTITEHVRKHGSKSLTWNWKSNNSLLIDLSSQIHKHSNRHKLCGIHFWLHQTKPIRTHLRVSYYDDKGQCFCFRVNLNFKNWRAVARIMTRRRVFKGLNKVGFEVEGNDPYVKAGQITFDLIRVATRCVGWTYDSINTPQIALTLDKRNGIGGIEDLNGVYEMNHYWQNMYKRRKIDLHYQGKIEEEESIDDDTMYSWTKQINRIENRVENWYFPAYRSNETLSPSAQARLYSLFYCNISFPEGNVDEKFVRWKKRILTGNFPYLRRTTFTSRNADPDICVGTAYQRFKELSAHGSFPSLFPSRDLLPHAHDDWSGLKFNEVIHRILFPMSLEYFISRSPNQRKQSLREGFRDPMRVLQKELTHEPELLEEMKSTNFKSIWKAYKMIDSKRFHTLVKLFKYIRREGWEDGSGLGNTDHLINQNWGFTHSLFLLRNDLDSKMKKHLLKTARWYNEMGEVHQEEFRHPGTTADKLRNLMISRLLIILAAPMRTNREARRKFTDLSHLKNWIENSLDINQGYGGLIKPDYTGYHHKGPYMTAYTTHALHALSLAAYFLHGTHFQISRQRLLNLKEALKTVYITSNARAIPLSVSGAKVAFNNVWVNRVFPAYAYLAIALQRHPGDVDKEMARMFLKLYKKDDPYLRYTSLFDGKVNDECQYLNSIGSIEVFDTVHKLARQNGLKEAESPNGHWTKSYASLSIHRRNEWTVTVKGFSKYVWDYESTVDQNVFGRYQSHGHMLIANGRKSLEVYDIFSGYDWNRVPGTTTVELELDELKSQEKCRYFSKRTTVGGLTYGKRRQKNGIYVMDFEQPQYMDNFFTSNRYSFKFKKSFFFFNNIIVCLGSNIQTSGLENKNVITTLFQNKLIASASIRMNNYILNRSNKDDDVIIQKHPLTFVDANKNGYFVPAKNGHLINMRIGKHRDPRTPNGKNVSHPKTYASVVFRHGSTTHASHGESYEYAVLVDSDVGKLQLFKKEMDNHRSEDDKPYTVMRQDGIAHIVRFRTEAATYTGYAIFDHDNFTGRIGTDVIREVNRPCILMVTRASRFVTINVMDPDLRMFDNYIPSSRSIRKDILYNSKSKPAWLAMSFNENLRLLTTKRNTPIRKNTSGYQSRIELLLSHGVTSEMKFRVMRKK